MEVKMVTKRQKENLSRLMRKPISKIKSLADAEVYITNLPPSRRTKAKSYFKRKYGFM